MKEGVLEVTSGYGAHTRQPYVALVLDDITMQIPPIKAREVAAMLVEAAEAAECDGFIFEFFQSKVEVSDKQAAAVLGEFRAWRERRHGGPIDGS